MSLMKQGFPEATGCSSPSPDFVAREQMSLKAAILEAIADMYSTSIAEVYGDVVSSPSAERSLEQFCEAMEREGY